MAAQHSGESLSTDTVTALLSPTLGTEKSAEVVRAAAQRLGVPEGGISAAQALAILEELGRTAGIVGVTARFARQRADFSRFAAQSGGRSTGATTPPPRALTRPPPPAGTPTRPPPAPTRPPPARASVPPPRPANRIPLSDLSALLAHSIGQEKAEEAVLSAVQRLGLSTEGVSKAEAVAVFEEMAKLPGLVGITARFAKGRVGARF